MSLDLGQLNWLAVLVGAAIYFVLGALWFAPQVFGRPWMAAIGWDDTRPRPEMNPLSYVGPGAFYLIAAIATGLLLLRPARTRCRKAWSSVWPSASDMHSR